MAFSGWIIRAQDKALVSNKQLQTRHCFQAKAFSYFSTKIYLTDVLLMSTHNICFCFVCVEVLRPSQPNGVMSSAVSLPNHTFIGQA